eukprot:Platyproteum_vivax@DN7972_c0_g1_i1.p1
MQKILILGDENITFVQGLLKQYNEHKFVLCLSTPQDLIDAKVIKRASALVEEFEERLVVLYGVDMTRAHLKAVPPPPEVQPDDLFDVCYLLFPGIGFLNHSHKLDVMGSL